jgi:hypothetical protein
MVLLSNFFRPDVKCLRIGVFFMIVQVKITFDKVLFVRIMRNVVFSVILEQLAHAKFVLKTSFFVVFRMLRIYI